ncbi:MAG: SAM-dependent DNA methyltransferase [Planctomycetes bacterium]|nr:SAM-dependent DNA methyltransferase [Planctomycetota bacterium]
MSADLRKRKEYGDWQTPLLLARQAVRVLKEFSPSPGTIVEPTCGRGSFLLAAHEEFPGVPLFGFDINPEHVAECRRLLPDPLVEISVEDFFHADWRRRFESLAQPVLVIGNLPWVTNAAIGQLGGGNLPEKSNAEALRGMDARTGKSNFDVSEWMLRRLLTALHASRGALGILCKMSVVRRVLSSFASELGEGRVEVRRIDAHEAFGASVDAALFLARASESRPAPGQTALVPVFASLSASRCESEIAFEGGRLINNLPAFHATRRFDGFCLPEWRSGVKHDCGSVMEFRRVDGALVGADGARLTIEPEYVYPLLKSSDLANGRLRPHRAMLVTQRRLGEDTSRLQAAAPLTWKYLTDHRGRLAARGSSIYRGQPEFAVFGVGDYSFAPWKVAVSGLHKRLAFQVVGPEAGRPVVFDDTCYFLPFSTREDAENAVQALRSEPARDFLHARIFWDSKRPITKEVLQSLDLRALQKHLRLPVADHVFAPAGRRRRLF